MRMVTTSMFAAMGLLLTATFANAAPVPLVTIDENGAGNFNGSTLPFTVANDPFAPGFAPTLVYIFPFQVVPGDLLLLEPGTSSSQPSDLVRFINGAAGGQAWFYSDLAETGTQPDRADVGIPPIAQSNSLIVNEVGPEVGSNGFLYAPTPNQPGAYVDPNGVPGQYNIISDVAVPEPTSVLTGVVGMGFLAKRSRGKRRTA